MVLGPRSSTWLMHSRPPYPSFAASTAVDLFPRATRTAAASSVLLQWDRFTWRRPWCGPYRSTPLSQFGPSTIFREVIPAPGCRRRFTHINSLSQRGSPPRYGSVHYPENGAWRCCPDHHVRQVLTFTHILRSTFSDFRRTERRAFTGLLRWRRVFHTRRKKGGGQKFAPQSRFPIDSTVCAPKKISSFQDFGSSITVL